MKDSDPLDIDRIRSRLAAADGPNYWRSLEEAAGSPAFGAFLEREFPRLAPVWEQGIDRRSVLKLMGAGLAYAGLAACSRQPPEQIVPYVEMPEYLVPGRPLYYATALDVGGYAHGVIAECHEGRPTKLEGNPGHPATRGALDAWTQAGVLSLYDPDRSQVVLNKGLIGTFGGFLSDLRPRRARWDANRGRGLCLLTDTVTSPSEAAAIEAMRARWPEMRWFAHEPVGREAVWAGARMAFGRALEPRYQFEAAQRVVTLDADFMGGQPGFLAYARAFMAMRRPSREKPGMSRLYAIEATPSITGAVADHRLALDAARIEAAARQLARALGVMVGAADEPLDPRWLGPVVRDLQEHAGAALVVPGEGQPPAVHALAHAINQALNAPGNTVVYQQPVAFSHSAETLPALTAAIAEDGVDSLLVMGANPVYTAAADLDFEQAYRRVPCKIHWGQYADETAALSHWHVPATHALEAWADSRAFEGTVSLTQPLIEPLYAGRTALQFLYAVSHGVPGRARHLLTQYWAERAQSTTAWKRWLRAGMVPGTAAEPVKPRLSEAWAAALPAPMRPADGLVLQFASDASVYDGRYANNAWLQELPRPLTKITWNNAAVLAPALAARHKLANGDVLRLQVAGQHLDLPATILPGQPENAVTVNLGYGRRAAGHIGDGVGANAYRLRQSGSPWTLTGLEIAATGATAMLATTQNHHAMEGRDLIRAAELEHFRRHPEFAQKPPPEVSLYPEPWPRGEPAERQWGMAIDLTACIGCNACVTACQAENNIPVVGAEAVARGREMHWIRIDRYFEGSEPGNPRMVFQPVPCMHCENAPCEYVCPVEATQHSADGLNEMIYNRCVGTRYCSQNCPYKVRRFNYFDYAGPDAEYPIPPAVQNPDVTVRSRGVMEKCTYCVQRIQRAEIEAAATDLPIADGAIVTACQQACPTRAIAFGDIAEKNSEVSRWKASPLNYDMLGHLNTRPRTTYLAAVRNSNPEMPPPEADYP